jgi:hypothetical protein
LVELRVVEAIADEMVRRTLKKNELKPWQRQQWCLPTLDADFVWRMEGILELYAERYDARYPVVCFDESSYQLVSEVWQPLPPAPGKPARYDYEYRRERICNLFMFFQPRAGDMSGGEDETCKILAQGRNALIVHGLL